MGIGTKCCYADVWGVRNQNARGDALPQCCILYALGYCYLLVCHLKKRMFHTLPPTTAVSHTRHQEHMVFDTSPKLVGGGTVKIHFLSCKGDRSRVARNGPRGAVRASISQSFVCVLFLKIEIKTSTGTSQKLINRNQR